MNKKRNTIIAIIFTFIIISTFVFFSIYSKSEDDWKNKSSNTISEEELEYERSIEIPLENLFNDETKDSFEILIEIEDTTEDINHNKNKDKLTGLMSIRSHNQNLRLKDKINWQNYFTSGPKQGSCGSCSALSIASALEAYFNKKYKFEQKISLSRQYLISYANFMGCSASYNSYYIKLLNLEGNNKDIETRNAYLKEKIKKEIELSDQFIKGTNILKTKTQYSIAAGEVPFGVPLTKQLPYVRYDSCQIVKINKKNPDFAVTGMDLRILDNIYSTRPEYEKTWNDDRKTILTKDFCPDSKDKGLFTNKITIPKRNDDFEKIFIDNYFMIDKSEDKEQNIRLIKEALKVSPLIIITPIFESAKYYKKDSVWVKSINDKKIENHSWVLSGWGVDVISGKEYWILKNSWSDNSFMRVWINDSDLLIEEKDNPIYGFSGEMVKIPGKELNKMLADIKKETKKQNSVDNLKKDEDETYDNTFPSYDLPTPDIKNKDLLNVDPMKEFNIFNVRYQDTKYISDEKCTTIMECIYDKLSVFYEDKKQEEFT